MIRTHVVIWVCGRAIWVWKWMTAAQNAALPHLTPGMVAAKTIALAKTAAVGIPIVCIGTTILPTPPADYVPRGPGREAIVAGPIGEGVSLRGVGARRSGLAPKAVPEPGTVALLAVGLVGLVTIRNRRE